MKVLKTYEFIYYFLRIGFVKTYLNFNERSYENFWAKKERHVCQGKETTEEQ